MWIETSFVAKNNKKLYVSGTSPCQLYGTRCCCLLNVNFNSIFCMVTTIYVAHENLMNNQVERRMWMEFAIPPISSSPYVGCRDI